MSESRNPSPIKGSEILKRCLVPSLQSRFSLVLILNNMHKNSERGYCSHEGKRIYDR